MYGYRGNWLRSSADRRRPAAVGHDAGVEQGGLALATAEPVRRGGVNHEQVVVSAPSEQAGSPPDEALGQRLGVVDDGLA